MSHAQRLKILKELIQRFQGESLDFFCSEKYLPPFERDSLNYGYMNSSEVNIDDME